jgi:carboxymethylenebutenolidase
VQPVIDTLKAAKKSYVNVEFSDADHGFFCDARPSYNPAAAAQAWPLTLAFLNTNLTEATRKAQA